MYNIRKIITLIYVFCIFGCSTSKEFAEINTVCEKLSRVESRTVSIGEISKDYEHFLSVFKKLSKKERKLLATKGNSISKLYASLFLINLKSKSITDVFISNISDHRFVEYMNGCVIEETQISQQMLKEIDRLLKLKREHSEFIKNRIKIYERDKKSLIEKRDKNNLVFVEKELEELYFVENWKLNELEKLSVKLKAIAINHKDSSNSLISFVKSDR